MKALFAFACVLGLAGAIQARPPQDSLAALQKPPQCSLNAATCDCPTSGVCTCGPNCPCPACPSKTAVVAEPSGRPEGEGWQYDPARAVNGYTGWWRPAPAQVVQALPYYQPQPMTYFGGFRGGFGGGGCSGGG